MARWRKQKEPGEAPTRDPNKAVRVQAALALRLEGKSYRTIAEALGYKNPGTVHHYIQQELDRCMTESVEHYRKLQNERLDALLASVWATATTPGTKDHSWYVDRALAIIAQQNKLNALDVVPESAAVASVPTIREYPEGVAEAV